MNTTVTQRLLLVTKILVSASLLSILLMVIDWRESLSLLVRVPAVSILLLVLIGIVMIGINSLKWQIFLQGRGIKVPIGRLILLHVVGYFFNNLLPSNVGGDVVRGFALGHQTGKLADSFGSVFLERFTGVVGLVVLAVVAFSFNFRILEIKTLWMSLLIFTGALIGIIILFFTHAARRLLDLSTRWGNRGKLYEGALRFLEAIYSVRSQPLIVIKAVLLSLLFHVMATVNTYVACRALSLDVALLDIAVIIPIILVVSMVPLSISSVGVWEGAFVYFFSLVGVSSSAALSIALLLRAKGLFFGLVGGAIFLLWKEIFQTSGEETRGQQPLVSRLSATDVSLESENSLR